MKKIIEVSCLPSVRDIVGMELKKAIQEQGYKVEHVRFIQLYELTGTFANELLHMFVEQLLVDQVAQRFFIGRSIPLKDSWAVEVWFKPGVTDVVGESILKAAKDMSLSSVERGRTGCKYIFDGRLNFSQIKSIAKEFLFNSLIQQMKITCG